MGDHRAETWLLWDLFNPPAFPNPEKHANLPLELKLMKINWKRVVTAGILFEILLTLIYVAAQYAGSYRVAISLLDMFGIMFWGGLWVVRKIESRFAMHGFLVGIIANLLYFPLRPLLPLLRPTDVQAGMDSLGSEIVMVIMTAVILKILGSTLGAYVGGRLRKKKLSESMN
jgi:hypothetical protein